MRRIAGKFVLVFGKAREVAKRLLFLMSENMTYMIRSELVADGGYIAI